jgi:hypothetical protein
MSARISAPRPGPARLEGSRQGDTINLRVTYAQPVGTDANARMIIRHAGGNQFSLTVNLPMPGCQVTKR